MRTEWYRKFSKPAAYRLLLLQLFLNLQAAVAQLHFTESRQAGNLDLQNRSVLVDGNEFKLVLKSAQLLQQDLRSATGNEAQLFINQPGKTKSVIIIGTIDKSSIIKKLIQQKKLNTAAIKKKWEAYFSQTLNFHNAPAGLRYAISIDGGKAQVIRVNKEEKELKPWEKWEAENIIIKTSEHQLIKTGKHVVRYYALQPGLVLQKLVIDFGGVRESYPGTPFTKPD